MKDRKEHANHRMWSQTLNYYSLLITMSAYVPGCTTTIKFSVARSRSSAKRSHSYTFRNSIQHSLIASLDGSNNYLNCTNNLERDRLCYIFNIFISIPTNEKTFLLVTVLLPWSFHFWPLVHAGRLTKTLLSSIIIYY
jgi:hypothetical protein